MYKYLYFSFLSVLLSFSSGAQQSDNFQKYRVFFSDKETSGFNAADYFHPLAIERRLSAALPLFDVSDLPVNPTYTKAIAGIAQKVGYASRWFNMIYASADSAQISRISKLPFVEKIEPVTEETFTCGISYDTYLSDSEKKLLVKQTDRMQGDIFRKNGNFGQGVRIAVFDAGFPGVDKIPVFQHIRKENRIVKTYDFAKNKENVYSGNEHGTMVLSCIAGMHEGTPMGLATQAEFLLARTEVESEPFSEEENWLAAAEWADKNGAHIINSSLGYTYHRYFTWEMDGKTSFVVKAANMAASKGILVVNAMGNDGDREWKILGTPADADSILSIGGINPETDMHEKFASYGPTADKRRKPNISAFSTAIVAGKSELQKADGTSFATPLITGFAACAVVARNARNGTAVFDEIQKSGDLYPYFDYAHGYGVPQASFFYRNSEVKNAVPTFSFTVESDSLIIRIDPKTIVKSTQANNYLFYKISEPDGEIVQYFVIDVYQENAIKIALAEIENNVVSASYKGFSDIFTKKRE